MLVQPVLLKPNILSEIEIKSGCVNLLFVFFVHMSVVGFFLKKKKGGLHQVSGTFLRPGDGHVRDGHHHSHRAIL